MSRPACKAPWASVGAQNAPSVLPLVDLDPSLERAARRFGFGSSGSGRAYLAVPRELDDQDVLAILKKEPLPLTLTLVHPL